MTYLSRISGLEGDDYKFHQALKNIFDQDQILFQRGKFETAVLSRKPPANHYPSPAVEEITSFLDGIAVGAEFLFTVRLNPVITRKINEKAKRVPVEQKQLHEWIAAKLDSARISAEFIYETEGPRVSLKKDHKITLSSVFVTGVCQVMDVDFFKDALMRGIGHSKGFGFGMLNIYANL